MTSTSVSPKTVLVIGGGLAGLSASAALADRGYRVTLLESRPRLGGRAASIEDQVTGSLIDHCQHVSMGCCLNFQKFCELTDTSHLFAVEPELHFLGQDEKLNPLKNSWLPAPGQLAWSFGRLSYLSWKEKWSLATSLLALVRAQPPASGKFIDWLKQRKQSAALIQRFWNLVLVSALSEDLERIDFYHGRKVFVDGFLKHRDAWKIHLLTIPLGEFYDEHLSLWLKNRSADIRCKAGVQELIVETNPNQSPRIKAVVLRDGSTISADHYVLAVPFDRALALLPDEVLSNPEFSRLGEFQTAPITSLHYWLDRELTPLRHTVLVDRASHWLFNRTQIQRQNHLSTAAAPSSDSQNSHYYQVVISNSRELKSDRSESQQELTGRIWKELQEAFPVARQAQVLHSRALTDHKAVFSVIPGIEQLRPPQQTPLNNLQLAGDYTQTGWPATMEGAVRSGFLAAENILHHDQPKSARTRILAPEQRSSLLLRLLEQIT